MEAMPEYEYNWLDCANCDETYAFETIIGNGAATYEHVRCPVCGSDLGEIRADLGYSYLGEIGSQFSCTAHPDGDSPAT